MKVKACVKCHQESGFLARGFLSQLLAAESNDQEGLKNIKEETAEKAADFEKYLAELEKLPLNPETQKAIAETRPEMTAYIAHTNKIVNVASTQGYQLAKAEITELTSREFCYHLLC